MMSNRFKFLLIYYCLCVIFALFLFYVCTRHGSCNLTDDCCSKLLVAAMVLVHVSFNWKSETSSTFAQWKRVRKRKKELGISVWSRMLSYDDLYTLLKRLKFNRFERLNLIKLYEKAHTFSNEREFNRRIVCFLNHSNVSGKENWL